MYGKTGCLEFSCGRLPDPQPRKVASVREVGRQPPIEPTKALPAGIWELTLAQETL